jgi:ferredoxin-NADP reductase
VSVDGWVTATVAQVRSVAGSGRILVLDAPGWVGNAAGQHLDVRLTADDGYQAVRSYSIASYGTSTSIEIAVDEVPDGEVSPFLVQDIAPGDALEVKGPLGGYFVWRPETQAPVQLVAGGSGVVPLVAMARAHHDSGSQFPFRMLYSVQSPQRAFYADELGAIVDDRFALDWVYTRAAPPNWPHPSGRLDHATLERLVFPAAARPHTYICGPAGFVEAAADGMIALGHDQARIKTERF